MADGRQMRQNIYMHMALCRTEHCKVETNCLIKTGYQLMMVVSGLHCNLERHKSEDYLYNVADHAMLSFPGNGGMQRCRIGEIDWCVQLHPKTTGNDPEQARTEIQACFKPGEVQSLFCGYCSLNANLKSYLLYIESVDRSSIRTIYWETAMS